MSRASIKKHVNPGRIAMIMAILSGGGFAETAAAQQPVPNNLFTASGFKVKFADTPEKVALLNKLPANKLVTRTKDGKTYYVYADPAMCRCAYVGTAAAYQTYQNGGLASGSGGESLEGQMSDDMTDANTPAVAGAPSFNEFVFGGLGDD
jgi:hypothetical protein